MSAQLEIRGVRVILTGKFNPLIFQPAWFAHWGLIREREAQVANVQVINPDTTVFTTEWLGVNVDRDFFSAATSQEPYFEPLRDLLLTIFELLSHTPVMAMEIDSDFHYRLWSEREIDRIGTNLAARNPWDGVLDNPTLESLTMRETRKGRPEGWIGVRVEPSHVVPPGVYIGVKDHYQWTEKPEPIGGTEQLREILQANWSRSLERSASIAAAVARLGVTE